MQYKKLSYLFTIAFFLFSHNAYARKRLCDILKIAECNSSNRNASKSVGSSVPSTSSSASINPSSIAQVKGLGLEALNYKRSFDFSIVTGTGRVGAAMSTSNPEDTFFGNISLQEDDSEYKARKIDQEKYRSTKKIFATSFNVFGREKSKKRYLVIDTGLILRYNERTKKYTGGAGVAVELGPFAAGISEQRDDIQRESTQIRRKYKLRTISFSIKLPYSSIDHSIIRNYIFEEPEITNTTLTIFTKKWMFTYGLREEYSSRDRYSYDANTFVKNEKKKKSNFLGVQNNLSKRTIVGMYYNYYLLNELSFSFAAFF